MARKDKLLRSIDVRPTSVATKGSVTSSIISTVPPAPGVLPAPFGLTGSTYVVYSAITPTVGVSLTWTPGEGTNPTNYTIQYSTDSLFTEGTVTTAIASTNSALIDTLTPNTLYYFRVASNYRNAQSPWSDTYSILTTSDTAPPDPVAQSSMAWSWPIGDLYLSWTNPTSSNFRDVRVEIWSDAAKTIKYVDTFTATGQYIFSAAQNWSVTSGNPDPSVYVELTSRSWSNVYSTATTFGPTSNPTTQPIKPIPATPTGLAADFTGRDCIITWNAVTGAQDYLVGIDGVTYVASDTRYVYSFDQNRVQHSGTPDPVLTINIRARDGILQQSTISSDITATNLPPSAVTSVITNWDGDLGTASADLQLNWDSYNAPNDIDRYELYVWENFYVGSPLSVIAKDKRAVISYSDNKNKWSSNGEPVLNYELYVVDVFNQGSSAKTGTLTNAAPPFPTVTILAGFTSIYGQITNATPIQDFDHYHYRLRLGGTSGVADGTIVREWDDVIDTPTFDVDVIGNYKIGVQIYDKFQQARAETVSDLVFIDALTLEELRAEGTYEDSIGTDFTTSPNNIILKDNATGAGITYTALTGTIGKTSIGGSTTDAAIDTKRVVKYNVSQTRAVSKLTAYLSGAGAGSGNQVAKAIIYTDNAGSPDTLVGTSVEVTITDGQAAGWVDFTFASPVNLAAGNYWIGLHTGSNTNTIRYYRDTGSSGVCKTGTDTYSDGPSATFGTATNQTTDISVYITYNDYRWIQFERPLMKIYRRITFKVGSGDPVIYFATSKDGSTWTYWANVLNGYQLEQHNDPVLAAKYASQYIYGFAELPIEVEARFVRVYFGGATRVDEYYPRTMLQSDDIAAEAIRALNIAAGAVVADKIAAGAVTAVKLSVGIGGGNILKNGGFSLNGLNWGYIGSTSTITYGDITSPYAPGYKTRNITNGVSGANTVASFQDITTGFAAGDTITISWYHSSFPVGKGAYVVIICGTDSSYGTITGGGTSPTVTSGNWQRTSYTFTIPANTGAIRIHYYFALTALNDIGAIGGCQVEVGDVATAWKAGYRGNVKIDGDGILVGVINGARTILEQNGLVGYNSSNVEQIRIDASNGELRAGTAGAQRVVINASGLSGYSSSNVLQAQIRSSDGKFTAGAGKVVADTDGIGIINGTTTGFYASTNASAVKFLHHTSGGVRAVIAAYDSYTTSNPTTDDMNLHIVSDPGSDGGTGAAATIYIRAIAGAGNGTTIISADTRTSGAGSVVPTITLQRGSTANSITAAATNLYIVGDTSWHFISDRNAKNNIKNISYGLKEILQLNPISYTYKNQDRTNLGFIAQDVEPIIPEIVKYNDDLGCYTMKTQDLLPVVIQAIKELNEKIQNMSN